MVVDGGMDGGEFLQTSHAPETLHGAFSSSEWQVRILNTVVEPPSRSLLFQRSYFSGRRLVGSETIRHNLFYTTVPLHQFLEEFQCCSFVSAFCNDGFQHLTLVIGGTPKVVTFAIHLHKNLVHVPFPFRERAKLLHPLSSDLRGKHRTEPVPPVADSFMAHIDPAFVQQVFDIPKRKRKSAVQHQRQTDDLRTGFEVFEGGRSGHSQTLRNRPAPSSEVLLTRPLESRSRTTWLRLIRLHMSGVY